jgi:hypothetical protein
MRALSIATILAAAIAGCGNDQGGGQLDLGMPTLEGAACVTDGDCKAPTLLCAYKIADGCGAKGHCAKVATPTCASFIPLCGCDGQTVKSGACFYQPGYASGPTTGMQMCNDGGT